MLYNFSMKTLLTLIIASILYAATNYRSAQVEEITYTFRANIKGYPPIIGERISIRVNGVDTPELRAKCEAEKILSQCSS